MKHLISQTQQNLLKAFAGESMARNKYTQYAKIARKEGLEWVARVFEETADNERAHAAELFEQITAPLNVSGELGIVPFTKTLENLKAAAAGEHYEWTEMYPGFEKIAVSEKAADSARLFGQLKFVEEKHEERYIIIAKKLDNNILYNSDAVLTWKCLNCGNIYKGKAPPARCPVCLKPREWFMPLGIFQ
jgi:rubrerythrin